MVRALNRPDPWAVDVFVNCLAELRCVRLAVSTLHPKIGRVLEFLLKLLGRPAENAASCATWGIAKPLLLATALLSNGRSSFGSLDEPIKLIFIDCAIDHIAQLVQPAYDFDDQFFICAKVFNVDWLYDTCSTAAYIATANK